MDDEQPWPYEILSSDSNKPEEETTTSIIDRSLKDRKIKNGEVYEAKGQSKPKAASVACNPLVHSCSHRRHSSR
ncbi:hypothetical protein Nepgr_015999 [Nepenthes gracilis]|uniref:Uncharacterized protein n=1 Tax=Nepenthes gracilis TaxID=150966 RepID=A0AAD3XR79_NEPGR|nr:hypothetical protein Nepgr_015999 [Nepenthes gracilis]